MKAYDLAGQRFARLTVVERVGADKHRYAVWRCVCDCGNETVSRGRHLVIGDVKSCGCLAREASSENGKHRATHGQSGSPAWRSWMSMRARCGNANDPYFHRYGGRGITICERWDDFALFLADMGERPAGKTLDRIDNDGDYEPGNCRWATYSEQARNRARRTAA